MKWHLALLTATVTLAACEADPEAYRPSAESWCKQTHPEDAKCADDQIAAARHLRILFPNELQRDAAIRPCFSSVDGWVDYVAVDQCVTRRYALLAKIRSQPTEFDLDDSEVPAAWGRAQSWIARHSDTRIQTVTEFLIETYNPQATGGASHFGYQVVRSPLKNGRSRLTISSSADSSWFSTAAADNAHILAFYVQTGDEIAQ